MNSDSGSAVDAYLFASWQERLVESTGISISRLSRTVRFDAADSRALLWESGEASLDLIWSGLSSDLDGASPLFVSLPPTLSPSSSHDGEVFLVFDCSPQF